MTENTKKDLLESESEVTIYDKLALKPADEYWGGTTWSSIIGWVCLVIGICILLFLKIIATVIFLVIGVAFIRSARKDDQKFKQMDEEEFEFYSLNLHVIGASKRETVAVLNSLYKEGQLLYFYGDEGVRASQALYMFPSYLVCKSGFSADVIAADKLYWAYATQEKAYGMVPLSRSLVLVSNEQEFSLSTLTKKTIEEIASNLQDQYQIPIGYSPKLKALYENDRAAFIQQVEAARQNGEFNNGIREQVKKRVMGGGLLGLGLEYLWNQEYEEE